MKGSTMIGMRPAVQHADAVGRALGGEFGTGTLARCVDQERRVLLQRNGANTNRPQMP
jgi:hypothetical protein